MQCSYEYTSSGTSVDSSSLVNLLLGGSIILIIFAFALSVFSIVVMWKIFQKAGKPGWAALIPGYNIYILFEITWGDGKYFLLLFLSIIPIIGQIAIMVVVVMTMIKLSKSFGKDTGFAVGLIFLSLVFMAILAFDSSTYTGVSKKDNEQPNIVPDQQSNVQQFNYQPQFTNTNQMANNTIQPNQTIQPNPVVQSNPVIEPNQMASTQTQVQPSFCANCGTQLTNEAAFCPNCGAPKVK